MPDSSARNFEINEQAIGTMLYRIGVALLVIFAILILASIIPVKLIDPDWQLRLVRSLVNNGTIAILGLVLVNLAPILSPSEKLSRRRLRIANLAVIASIGYLLIVPLQGAAIWQGLSSLNNAQFRQLQVAKDRIEQIRKAVNDASSTADLQRRLQAIPGPGFPPIDPNRPIATVRPQLLSALNAAQGQVQARSTGLPADRLQQLIQESIRVGLSALVFAMAFACGSVWPGGSRSLFDIWVRGFRIIGQGLFGGKGAKAGRHSKKSADQDYLDQISGGGTNL
ncbi:MAG: HpsJ family protein [Synechococcaceae cyanobacterium]|nr:HpsJ family protein [Synechococcaceae cyanobacterium]